MTDPRTLRRSGPWQVLVVEGSETMEHLEVVGLALIVDVRADRIRGAVPLTDLADLSEAVVQAAVAPAGDCKPARPRSLQCLPRHAGLLADAGSRLQCGVKKVGKLKQAEAAAANLVDYLSPNELGLPVTDAPWSQLSETVFAAPPWTSLNDGVEFHIRSKHPDLNGRVAIVLGLSRQQFGFSIFPSAESLDRFRNRAVGGPDPMANLDGMQALLVHYDPLGELPKRLVQAARRAGLVFREPGGLELVQTLLVLQGPSMEAMEPVEELVAAGVLEAVMETWRRHGVALAFGGGEARIQLSDGRVVEVLVPSQATLDFEFDDDLFDDTEPAVLGLHDHLVILRSEPGSVPDLIFKYAKAHAKKAAASIEGIEWLEVVGEPGQPMGVFGGAADQSYGLLWVLDADHPARKLLTTSPELHLIISAGGAKRRTFHPKDVVYQAQVRVDRVHGADVQDAVEDDSFDFDTLDPDGVLAGKDWSGPPNTWPSASAALIAFGAPLELDGAPEEVADVMYRLLALVWNAVVAADFMEMPDKVEQVRSLVLPLPVPDAVDRLIARKRSRFARDNRVMIIRQVTVNRSHVNVGVEWRFGTPEIGAF